MEPDAVFGYRDIFTLNDPSELVFALEVAAKLAKSQADTEEMRLLSDQLEHFISLEAASAIATYYVCSFSANGDDLGQWRSYADNAHGFALEFDTASLEAAFTKNNGEPIANNSTFPVEYDNNKLERLVGQLIHLLAGKIAFVRRVMPDNATAYGAYMSSLLLTTALHFYRLSLFFKHSAYLPEGEYRFLALYGVNGKPTDLKWRTRQETRIGYLELPWLSLAPSALKSIRVGPAAIFEEAKEFANAALKSAGISGVPIIRSSIPYRA